MLKGTEYKSVVQKLQDDGEVCTSLVSLQEPASCLFSCLVVHRLCARWLQVVKQ